MTNRNPKASVAIIGQGYVGLPLAIAAWEAGHNVIGVDSDLERLKSLAEGHSPTPDINSATVRSALKSGRYSLADSVDNLSLPDFVILTVPTPLRDGVPDLHFVQFAAEQLAPKLRRGTTVILESTTYPGTTEELLCPVLESGSGLKAGTDFHVGYSPERIDPGNKTWGLTNTPKVVSGVNPSSLSAVSGFYESLGISTVPVSGTREAELTKLLENTFRHVNIALVNELTMFASHLKVNIWEAINAADTKPFGFMRFEPGPGVGGHCLPVDPTYLSWAIQSKSNSVFKFVELANEINRTMPTFVIDRAKEMLAENGKELSGARVVLYGLAYKPGTSDMRESPSLAVASLLKKLGAKVYALDEYIPYTHWPLGVAQHDPEQAYDIGILLTAHDREVARALSEQCEALLDTRNTLDGSHGQPL